MWFLNPCNYAPNVDQAQIILDVSKWETYLNKISWAYILLVRQQKQKPYWQKSHIAEKKNCSHFVAQMMPLTIGNKLQQIVH